MELQTTFEHFDEFYPQSHPPAPAQGGNGEMVHNYYYMDSNGDQFMDYHHQSNNGCYDVLPCHQIEGFTNNNNNVVPNEFHSDAGLDRKPELVSPGEFTNMLKL